ncbi:MAG: GGDEF domain-containing protein [Endomicrobiales bacterium]
MADVKEALYRSSVNFQEQIRDLDESLRRNLELLIKALDFDRAAVFLLDEKGLTLRPRHIVTVYGEMEGEGEHFLSAHRKSNFSLALRHEKEIVCAREPEYSMYWPLVMNTQKLGVLRVDNVFSRKPVQKRQVAGMRTFGKLFSRGIYNSLAHQHFAHQVDKLTTLTRIGNAIATTLKLSEILELALSSLVKDLGYDRAQVYLLDEGGTRIVENLSIDFRGYFRMLEDVSSIYPVFESILSETKPSLQSRKFSSNLIAYIPIICKGKKTGLLVVDNLFTRQTLTSYDLSFLGILADQFGTVIENSRLFERVEKLSITDGLTGLFNHRYFYERLSEEISRANRFGKSLSLLMLDIDHFKNFNDAFGHQAGDTVLTTVTRLIQDNIRSIDVASRYGGEEVAIILPGTDIEGAKIIAERIRQNIQVQEFRFNQQATRITVSIGLVCYPIDTTIKSDLVRKADQALYWVKNHGRNAICAYSRCEDLL